jgi:hypothetical protein
MKRNLLGKQVWAHYHCWYGTPTGPNKGWRVWNHPLWDIAKGNQTIAQHNPEKIIGTENRRDIGAANYPLLEPYDSQDKETLKQHVLWAKEGGIDGFIFDWWGPEDVTDKSMQAMLEMLKEENISDFHVTVLLDGPWARKDPVEKTIKHLQYLHDTYKEEAKYLHVGEMPVICAYACMFYNSEQWREIREKTETEGRKICLLGDSTHALDVFDGLQTYSPGIRGEADLRRTYSSFAKAAKERDMFFALATLPGYDDRSVRFPGSVIPRRSGEHYDMTWRVVLEQEPDWVLICSWNEWAEGSNIEPDREHSKFYLEKTVHFVQQFTL